VFLAGGDELAVRLRELAFGVILRTKSPVEPATLTSLAGSDEGRSPRRSTFWHARAASVVPSRAG
jgi:hypothetical protein